SWDRATRAQPLIVPWLMEQLDARRYPGLSWLNPERTLFRVPWKHGSRQNILGRHRPGIDQRTPSEWKRNFRSALNRKEGIRMFQDNSTDSEDPHKVFLSCEAFVLRGTTVLTFDTAPSLERAYAGCVLLNQRYHCTLEDLRIRLCWYIEWAISLEEVWQFAALCFQRAFQNDTGCCTSRAISRSPPGGTAKVASPAAGRQEEWVVFCTWLPQTIPLSSSESDFEVRVYYRGRLVLADVFKNVRGLRFVPPGSQGHYPDLADVVLPDPVCLNDSLQVTYTQRLLRGVAPGVVLRIEGITLCGMRQGHCHVSWSQSEMPEDETPHGALLKEQLGPIYSLQQFVQDLVGYMEGRQGSPKYTLWLCFGEDWPDTRRPWKKKLLMVEVSTSVPFHALLKHRPICCSLFRSSEANIYKCCL
uniref:Interferon regulatory factor 3 n=1 Tax=Podarcis muralis TaxID=64176 RepID=A0A670IWX8_PODMU